MLQILFSLLVVLAVPAFAADENVNFAPPLILSGIDNQLPDLIGSNGSQLCAPVALTHGFQFLRRYRNPAYTQLPPVADIDRDGQMDTAKDWVRYFFAECGTDREIGTRYRATIACMRKYIGHSVYEPWAYMIGPHAVEAPPGYPIESVQHVLKLNEIRYYVSNQALVLMGIGWYRYNPANGLMERQGGHFFNLYGYEFRDQWGESQMNLFVVNSWVNYHGRPAGQAFDRVLIRGIQGVPAGAIPRETAFELVGEGFNFGELKAYVEDIFVAYPGVKAQIPYALIAENANSPALRPTFSRP